MKQDIFSNCPQVYTLEPLRVFSLNLCVRDITSEDKVRPRGQANANTGNAGYPGTREAFSTEENPFLRLEFSRRCAHGPACIGSDHKVEQLDQNPAAAAGGGGGGGGCQWSVGEKTF